MATSEKYDGFTAEERDAMKQRAKELKAGSKAAEAEAEVLAKIAEMPEDDRVIAERVHAIIKEHAPELAARTWYGMPAYAKDGKILCHFQPSPKFKTRYPTFTFSDVANLDDGDLWPVSFAITSLSAAVETKLAALVKQAVS